MTAQLSPWQIDGFRARLSSELLHAEVDLRRPGAGLLNLVYDGSDMKHLHVLQVAPKPLGADPDSVAESYVRGCDLVAIYDPSPPRTACSEIYWRALDLPDRVAGIELVISTHTGQLRSDPRLAHRSVVQASEVWWWSKERSAFEPLSLSDSKRQPAARADGVDTFLFRLSKHQASYLEIVSASDVEKAIVGRLQDAPTSIQLSYELFPEALEKGVIRRVRLRGLLLPRENDQNIARECCRQMSTASPPLTT